LHEIGPDNWEHKVIFETSRQLVQAASVEGVLKTAALTEHLMLWVWIDEMVFYHGAIQFGIGEYLKLRLAEHAQAVKVRFGMKPPDADGWLTGNYESL
jgi:hypothetical protein